MSSLADIPAVLAAPFTSYPLHTHPNTFALDPTSDIPPHLHYTSVLRAYLAEDETSNTGDLPPHIAHLIASVRRIQLPRNPIDIPNVDTDDAQRRYPRLSQGMSPKKAHEVSRMAAYILALVRANGLPTEAPDSGSQRRLHIVDVGAGQGYLTRVLHALLPHARILALDADHAQSAGAIKWEERLFVKDDEKTGKDEGKAGIEHRTVLIGAEGDPEELRLRKVISEWVRDGQVDSSENESGREQAPVLFVALHACGSLTPALLRAFLAASKTHRDEDTGWRPAGAVAVGCCYNLMNPTDFPLSTTLRTYEPPLNLPPAAFHLAAQIPGTWLARRTGPNHETSPRKLNRVVEELKVAPTVALAIRKVAWRALLEHALQTSRPMTDEELRDAEEREKVGVQTRTPTSSGRDSKETLGDGGGSELKESKKAKKQAKKEMNDVKEKKPSATVPARWQRRPENWAPDADEELDTGSSSSTALSVPPGPIEKADNAATTPEAHGQFKPQDHSAPSSGIGATPALRRLGRLRDSAYTTDWESFLREAGARMGVVFEGKVQDENENEERTVLETQLETLHVLRCLVGPAIESAILRDRQGWVREALSSCAPQGGSRRVVGIRQQEPLKVELVNLFDQETGSGRNVAIVISSCIPCMSSSSS